VDRLDGEQCGGLVGEVVLVGSNWVKVENSFGVPELRIMVEEAGLEVTRVKIVLHVLKWEVSVSFSIGHYSEGRPP
jgi:hypothetical protein